jgi:hypothetical protein
MNELDQDREAALIECLRALDAGSGIEAALAGYPQHAAVLRPYLELRARLLAAELPPLHPADYQAGRQALLDRLLASERQPAGPDARLLGALTDGWHRLGSPAARLAAVAVAVAVLGLGALGASAAGGVGPAREVLSALRIVPAAEDEAPADGLGQQDAGAVTPAGGAPTAVATGDAIEPGPPREVPGVGLCFDGDRERPPGLPEDVLQRLPDAGLCVPDGLIEHSAEERPCLPPGLLDRFPSLREVAGDDAVCGNPDGDATPAEERNGPPETVPAPADRPHGPPDGAGPPDGLPADPPIPER